MLKKKFRLYDFGDPQKVKLIEGWLYVKLEITQYCNFQCSYCCVSAPQYRNQSFVLNKDNFQKVISFLRKQKAPGLIIEFFGGEPTLHPDLKYFIDELRKNFPQNLSFILMTNLSAPLELYLSLPDEMEVVVGYHSKYNKVDHYIKKAHILSQKFRKFTTILLLHPQNRDSLAPDIPKFRSMGMKASVLPLINTGEQIDFEFDTQFNQDNGNVLDEKGELVSRDEALKYNSFTGMFCFPNINIMADGRVQVCTQRDTHIDRNEKIRNMVLCSKIRCNDCERANPKISIDYAREKRLI